MSLERNAKAARLREWAQLFGHGRLVKTSDLILSIADKVTRGVECERDCERLYNVLRSDLSETDVSSLKLFDLVRGAIVARPEKFIELYEILDSLQESTVVVEDVGATLLGPIDRREITIKDMLSDKELQRRMFHGYCLLYLLTVEGQFDVAIRLLYYMVDPGVQGYSELEEMEIRDIRTKLLSLGSSDWNMIFSGWKDGHLRNSIAHCRFTYDAKSAKMTFTDYDPWREKKKRERGEKAERWHETLSFADFVELYAAVDYVLTILYYLFDVLMIHGYAIN